MAARRRHLCFSYTSRVSNIPKRESTLSGVMIAGGISAVVWAAASLPLESNCGEDNHHHRELDGFHVFLR
jgi:hypothetical protein